MTEFKEALHTLALWEAYQNDMRPETRNDFLRTFHKSAKNFRRALLIADGLMQEPSRAMEEIGSGNGTPRHTGWKKPLTPGMRVACTIYDEYERAANCFKDMRDQLIREIENA